MTPFFSPGPNPYGPPKVFLAAVGELMTEVAGEVADGMILHPLHHRALRARGHAAGASSAASPQAAGTRADFDPQPARCSSSPARPTRSGTAARTGTKQQIAFYGSTPGYHGVLRLHGWDDLGTELNELSRKGEWVAMGELITDEVLETFAVVAEPDALAAAIVARYGDVLDRLNFDAPYQSDPEIWTSVLHQLKTA